MKKRAVPVEVMTVLRSDEVVEENQTDRQRYPRSGARVCHRAWSVWWNRSKSTRVMRWRRGDTLLRMDSRLAEIELELVRAQIETAEIQRKDAIRRFDEVKELIDDGAFAKTEAGNVASQRGDQRSRFEGSQSEGTTGARTDRAASAGGAVSLESSQGKRPSRAKWVDTGTMVLELVETEALWFDLQIAQEFRRRHNVARKGPR